MVTELISANSTGHPLRSITRISRNDSSFNYKGYSIILNRNARISQFVDRGMFDYDFSKNRIIPDEIADFDKNPHLKNTEFKPMVGKTIRQIYESLPPERAAGPLLIVNGQEGNGFECSSMIVNKGELITKTAPGVGAKEKISLSGEYPLFLFSDIYPSLETVKIPFNCKNWIREAIFGPVLFDNSRCRIDEIKHVFPNIKPQEVPWDPKIMNAAMSVLGVNTDGFTFIATVTGETGKELTFTELRRLLEEEINVYSAILLGISGDAGMLVKPSIERELWLSAQGRPGTVFRDLFPVTWGDDGRPIGGRPLSNAIIVEAQE